MSTRYDAQEYYVGQVYTFFEIDATAIGGSVYKLTPHSQDIGTDPIAWRNVSDLWTPYPIEVSGFETDGTGAQPRPTMRLATLYKVIAAALYSLDDFVNVPVTRHRVFAKYVYGQPSFNANEIIDSNLYFIQRKVLQNRNVIELELGTGLAKENIVLPREAVTVEKFPGVKRLRD